MRLYKKQALKLSAGLLSNTNKKPQQGGFIYSSKAWI